LEAFDLCAADCFTDSIADFEADLLADVCVTDWLSDAIAFFAIPQSHH